MNHNEYNGWFNYETWVIKLWIDNEQASYNYWRDAARGHATNTKPNAVLTAKELSRINLAEQLKEYHEQYQPEVKGVWQDLLGAALSEVNWMEIAENMLEEFEQAEAS